MSLAINIIILLWLCYELFEKYGFLPSVILAVFYFFVHDIDTRCNWIQAKLDDIDHKITKLHLDKDKNH